MDCIIHHENTTKLREYLHQNSYVFHHINLEKNSKSSFLNVILYIYNNLISTPQQRDFFLYAEDEDHCKNYNCLKEESK